MFVLGAPPGTSLAAGSSAGLFLALANTGPADRLVSVTAPGTASSVTLPGQRRHCPAEPAVLLTGPAPAGDPGGLTRSLTGGTDIRVVLHFQNAGSVALRVPVMAQGAVLRHVLPGAGPRRHAAATPTPGGHGRAAPARHRHATVTSAT